MRYTLARADLWKNLKRDMEFENCASFGETAETWCVCVEENSQSGGFARKAPEEAMSMGQDRAVLSVNLLDKSRSKAIHP